METGVPGGKPPESVIEGGGQSMPEKYKRSKLEDMIILFWIRILPKQSGLKSKKVQFREVNCLPQKC